jgi:hypothetical protein
MTAIREINFSELMAPTPKQREALGSTARFTLYGGALGGGKSYLLRWAALRAALHSFANYGVRGAQVMICCEDYPSLRDRQLVKFETEILKYQWLGEYRSSVRAFRLFPEYGGGSVCFRNLDDPSKYASSEWFWIGWDECTLLPNGERAFLDLATKRLRFPPIPTEDCLFMGTCNPTGPGIGWVKRRWIDRMYPDDEDVDPADYRFIQSLVTDNPHIDDGYRKRLLSLPEKEKQALLYGSWDALEGAFFTEFSKDVHVEEPFTIPEGVGTFYGSFDWGFSAPSAFLLHWIYAGHWHIIAEMYVTRQSTLDLARGIKAVCGKNKPSIIPADPSIWTKHPDTGASIAGVLLQQGIPVYPGNNDRVNGWSRLREWMRPYDVLPENGKMVPFGTPLKRTSRFHIWNTCPNTIRVFPNMMHNKLKPEDLDSDGEDHIPDSARMLAMHLPPPDALGTAAAQQSVSAKDKDLLFRIANGLAMPDGDEEGGKRSAGW